MKFDELLNINQTAFYVFDIAVLKKRIKSLREQLPAGVSVCYAMKANSFVTKEIANYVERIEVCSQGESDICHALGIDKSKMVISGVTKSNAVIEEAASCPDFNGILTAESQHQYIQILSAAKKYRKRLTVLLRLTNDSQFGMDEETLEEIIAQRQNHPEIEIAGIQYFSGTQKSSQKKLARELEYLDGFLVRLKEKYNFSAKELEYGPGFPVSYFESDSFEETSLLSAFSDIIGGMISKPQITLELGRSIAASCGNYYTHIVDIKRNKGQNYALVDGGMHQMIYFGQQMAMKRPFMSVLGKKEQPPLELWNICGSLCTMNDFIVKQMPLPDIETGDVLCFHNTGAYCMTEGMSLFLSRELPAVYLTEDTGDIICVRRAVETAKLNTPDYERIKENG